MFAAVETRPVRGATECSRGGPQPPAGERAEPRSRFTTLPPPRARGGELDAVWFPDIARETTTPSSSTECTEEICALVGLGDLGGKSSTQRTMSAASQGSAQDAVDRRVERDTRAVECREAGVGGQAWFALTSRIHGYRRRRTEVDPA
jgi:hypothetical protein